MIENMQKNCGYLFVFEGGEGSGKSTAIKKVKEKLEKDGYKVLVTREPGGCDISEQIRNIILNNKDMDIETELLLFLAARKEHYIKIVKPALKDKYIVLMDRFMDSTIVYQGIYEENTCNCYPYFEASRDLLMKQLNGKDGYFGKSYYLRLSDPEIGLNRIKIHNRETNKFDEKGIKFHKTIQKRYDKLYGINNQNNSQNIQDNSINNYFLDDRYDRKIINADNTIAEVVNEIYKDILNTLKDKE